MARSHKEKKPGYVVPKHFIVNILYKVFRTWNSTSI
jgi:hypothetical protein